jgi:hypothetical protein
MALPEQPTAKEVKGWDANELLQWIQETSPNLLKNNDHLERFKVQYITGKLFLIKAGQGDFFENRCNLPAGPSEELSELASEIVRRETSELTFFIYTIINTDSLLSSISFASVCYFNLRLDFSYKWIPPVLKYSLAILQHAFSNQTASR